MTRKDFSTLAIVVLIGLILQVGLIALDCTHSPSDTAVSYAEAYYKLDPAMAKWLCDGTADASCDNPSAVCPNTTAADHIYNATANAAERGFGKGVAKYTLSHIETRTQYLDDTTAEVHLTARSRLAINPLYAWVARLFRMGETHEVEETIRVKLEDGSWRVCQSSALPETS